MWESEEVPFNIPTLPHIATLFNKIHVFGDTIDLRLESENLCRPIFYLVKH